MAMILRAIIASTCIVLSHPAVGLAQPSQQSDTVQATDTKEKKPDTDTTDSTPSADTKAVAEGALPAGHSQHGESFNQGPRQKAYLMRGTGKIRFPVSSKVANVQEFVEQGIGQVHGFWYFEAERSFRQAATLDPNCAIAYWGMALANANNSKRSKGFIAEAVQRKQHASPRESMYIDALSGYLNNSDSKKRPKPYLAAIDKIIERFPDDLEAKALRCYTLYKSRALLKRDYKDVDQEIAKVLAVEPTHPVHHYRIHLWDYKDSARALTSAAACGQAAPSIAHMWHMPGHIYSRQRRYDDAVYHQEASARVDHAQMMRDRVMPDQIHNFAHNNEWLVRSLQNVGRWHDAVELAKNMIELPRHPKYNTLAKRGSSKYGRMRLLGVLRRYEQWREVIRLADTSYLEPSDVEAEQVKRLEHLGIAYVATGDAAAAQRIITELQTRKSDIEAKAKKEQDDAEAKSQQQEKAKQDRKNEEKKPQEQVDPAKEKGDRSASAEQTKKQEAAESKTTASKEAEKKTTEKKAAKKTEADKKAAKKKADALKARIAPLDKAIALIQGRIAIANKDYAAAVPLLEKGSADKIYLAKTYCLAGQNDKGVKTVTDFMKKNAGRIQFMAGQIEVLWLADRKDDARKVFDRLRWVSGSLQAGTPIFDRLNPIAKQLGYPEDWRFANAVPSDIGVRPSLDSLGPFRWQPGPAHDWSLKDHLGKTYTLRQYRGRPVIIIFYLGYACLHCAEQLQAFAPMAAQFEKAGISIIAISTDEPAGLKTSLKDYEGVMPFPLLSNAGMDVFKAYRAYDDFENIPLHGTYLIDPVGRVRWQDISFEPFMDAKFLLTESQRLLAQQEKPSLITQADPPPVRPKDAPPVPAPVEPLRIVPAGIAGSLVIAGGDVPDAAWQRFAALGQGSNARILILRTDSTSATKSRVARLVAQLNESDAASISVIRVTTKKDVDEKTIAAMKNATAVWLAGDNANQLRTLVRDTSIQHECQALLARGGVLGGAAASLAVMSQARMANDPKHDVIKDGLAFLPGSMIDVVSVNDDTAARLPKSLDKLPGTVGYEIDSNTALVIHNRRITAVGPGSVRIYLAASKTRKAKQIVLSGPRTMADLTTLRRAAANRATDDFPSEKLGTPEVEKGTLIMIGGGGMPAGVMKKFVDLAGGNKASIVVLPTANPDPVRAQSGIAKEFEKLGAKKVTVLPGRTLDKVESDEYGKALGSATGVWFGGGRQWRFVDAYAGTKAEELLHGVLARGGVIMGSSAGASIQAEYLARGNPLGNLDIMAEGYERGLGFLPGVAVDQHFSERKRFADMTMLVKAFPQILGIGIDESTALMVSGKIGEVTGRGGVHFYDAAQKPPAGKPDVATVRHGGKYDLVERKVFSTGREQSK